VDSSRQGIDAARRQFPGARWEVLAAESDILQTLNELPFDLVVSTEVIEHLYAPRDWARACFASLKPGGRLICTTPYHGYLKNIMLSIFNKWDSHADPLWDGGHIKLWSRKSLGRLLTEVGLRELQFRGAGRFPYLWMAMAMSGEKPR
jgi:2-polyprenyl-3-methyl-5-hydroxy-6-metoxy-1,4-benzoquinol methylase